MITYFIEHKETNQWLKTSQKDSLDFIWDSNKAPNYTSSYSWTIDPHEADKHQTREHAEYTASLIYWEMENKNNWIITEHEFIHYKVV